MFDVMGAVLAGGRSQRMGSDKASLQLSNGIMGEIVTRTMQAVLDHVVVVGRSNGLAGAESLPDQGIPHQGPLAGLVTALGAFRTATVLVGVDQPLLRQQTVAELAELGARGHTAVCHDEVPQVLCAVFQPDIVVIARRHLEGGGSIQTLLGEIPHTPVDRDEWERWGEDGRSWCSLDSRDAIVAAERQYRIDLLD